MAGRGRPVAALAPPYEHAEQVAVVRWFGDYACRRWPWLRLPPDPTTGVQRPAIYAVPNGGFRGKRTAAIMAAEGVSAGVPDLHVPALHLRIEMKRRKGGRTSDAQDAWIAYLRACGDRVEVCPGATEAIAVILQAAEAEAQRRKERA
jgi:hypothetical protein